MKIFKTKSVDLEQVCFLARKHGFIQFDGSCLNVPADKFQTIFLAKPISTIRKILGSMETNHESFVEEVEERNEWYDQHTNEILDHNDIKADDSYHSYIKADNSYHTYLEDQERNVTIVDSTVHFEQDIQEQDDTSVKNEFINDTNNQGNCSNSQRLQILITCKNDNEDSLKNGDLTGKQKDYKFVCDKHNCPSNLGRSDDLLPKSKSEENFSTTCQGVHVLITCTKDNNSSSNNEKEGYCVCNKSKPVPISKQRSKTSNNFQN